MIPRQTVKLRTGIRAGVELPQESVPAIPAQTDLRGNELGLPPRGAELAQRFVEIGEKILVSTAKSQLRRVAAQAVLYSVAVSMGLPAALTVLCLMRIYQGYEIGRDVLRFAEARST